MPQHPVYTKLGINKYCIKNQHPGLSALIRLSSHISNELTTAAIKSFGAGTHCFSLEFILSFSSDASARPLPVHCLVFAQVMEVS